MAITYRITMRAFMAAALALCMSGAQAQDQNAANAQRNALNKAQFMLKQATAEKAEAQRQVEALKQQVEKLTRDATAAQSDASANRQKLQAGFAETIEQWRQRDAKQAAQIEELRAQLKAQAERGAALDEQLAAQTGNFEVCYGNNRKLLDLNREILARYQDKGVFDALRQKEPVTGLSRVEVENLVEDYRYRIDDLTIDAPTAAPQ